MGDSKYNTTNSSQSCTAVQISWSDAQRLTSLVYSMLQLANIRIFLKLFKERYVRPIVVSKTAFVSE